MLIQHAPLVLASGSTIRQQMLKAVGLTFSVVPSGVDETAIKAELKNADIPTLAIALARAKALSVSKSHPGAYTIGAECEIDGDLTEFYREPWYVEPQYVIGA